MFQVNPLLGAEDLQEKIKPYFFQNMKYKIKTSSAAFLFGTLRVNFADN